MLIDLISSVCAAIATKNVAPENQAALMQRFLKVKYNINIDLVSAEKRIKVCQMK
jgi:hypothetical protein